VRGCRNGQGECEGRIHARAGEDVSNFSIESAI
jgi:hypothetical protein